MKTTLAIDFSKLSDSQMSNIIDILMEQHGEKFDDMTKRPYNISLVAGGSPHEEKQEPIYVVATETMRLIPFSEFGFTWRKNSTMTTREPIYVPDMNTIDSWDIPKSEETRLIKLMKKHKTEIFTDGHGFYTTMGTRLTKVEHPRFKEVLESDEWKEKIHELLYG